VQEIHAVVLHARSEERVTQAGDLAGQAYAIVTGDLSSGAETRGVAEQVDAIGHMDAVIHNAGIYTVPDGGWTPEGHATVLAVNTLAPYILTALIARPSRRVYLSSELHRGGEGSLADVDWTTRRWDSVKAYAESKLHVAALAAALSRRWPDVLSNSVDPGLVRTKMAGHSAPVDLDTGQRTQTWLAASEETEALVSGGYWHNLRQQQPASEVTDAAFQDQLLAKLRELTGISLP
jgi:NAD(P)-dependent dehydrogenase (short-subunit alcohol dehydrogenase family)